MLWLFAPLAIIPAWIAWDKHKPKQTASRYVPDSNPFQETKTDNLDRQRELYDLYMNKMQDSYGTDLAGYTDFQRENMVKRKMSSEGYTYNVMYSYSAMPKDTKKGYGNNTLDQKMEAYADHEFTKVLLSGDRETVRSFCSRHRNHGYFEGLFRFGNVDTWLHGISQENFECKSPLGVNDLYLLSDCIMDWANHACAVPVLVYLNGCLLHHNFDEALVVLNYYSIADYMKNALRQGKSGISREILVGLSVYKRFIDILNRTHFWGKQQLHCDLDKIKAGEKDITILPQYPYQLENPITHKVMIALSHPIYDKVYFNFMVEFQKPIEEFLIRYLTENDIPVNKEWKYVRFEEYTCLMRSLIKKYRSEDLPFYRNTDFLKEAKALQEQYPHWASEKITAPEYGMNCDIQQYLQK